MCCRFEMFSFGDIYEGYAYATATNLLNLSIVRRHCISCEKGLCSNEKKRKDVFETFVFLTVIFNTCKTMCCTTRSVVVVNLKYSKGERRLVISGYRYIMLGRMSNFVTLIWVVFMMTSSNKGGTWLMLYALLYL
jgi:hypothetical protein